MSPEYGATCGFFPVDEITLDYLRLTGRSAERVALVEAYCKENLLWHDPADHATYSQVVELDLGDVEPSLAGPRRPQDRVPLAAAKQSFLEALGSFGVDYDNGSHDRALADTFPASDPTTEQQPGGEPQPDDGARASRSPPTGHHRRARSTGADYELDHGAVVIAAITSCTNTSNPQVMIAAGPAREEGRRARPHAQAVGQVVARAGLARRHATTTSRPACRPTSTSSASTRSATAARRASATRGRSPTRSRAAITEGDLVACAVLSGNRNFEARIHPEVKANYLASPPLVVAYALAGRMDIDLETEPLGRARRRRLPARHLADRARDRRDDRLVGARRACSRETYADVFTGDDAWRSLPVPEGELFAWEPGSTYVRRPPYFEGMSREPGAVADIEGARCLVWLGDSVTTDHISPAGSIKLDSPAGALPRRARRRARGLQLVRRAPRQPRGDGARHVRQRAAAQPARAGLGGDVDGARARRARR